MKKGLKRKKNEPITGWISRVMEKIGMTQEQVDFVCDVFVESFDEGVSVGKEIEKLKNIKNNEN